MSWARTEDLLAFCAIRSLYNNVLNKLEVDTIRLARDVNGNYVAGGSPGFVVGGCYPSWSPDDAQLVINGITVFVLATGTTHNLVTGVGPDWRR